MLGKKHVIYKDLGLLADQVIRDTRLTAQAKLLVLAVAYLTNLRSGELSWAQIEQYTGLSRGSLYWSAKVAAAKTGLPCPLHQAIEAGYLKWEPGLSYKQLPRFAMRVADAGDQLPDAGHQLPDAGHQLPDAGHQLPDAGDQVRALQTGSKPSSGQGLTAFQQAQLSLGIYPKRSEISEIPESTNPGVDKAVDNSALLSESHMAAMRGIFMKAGMTTAQVDYAIEKALSAVAHHNVRPGHLVLIQKELTRRGYRNNGQMLKDWEELLHLAATRKLRYR